MTYKVVIKGVDTIFPLKGLNELLESRLYNPRTKKYHNPVKTFNDRVCLKAIKRCLPSVHIDKPIKCTFYIYAADKMHDRGNLCSAIEKSFLDALQIAKVIKMMAGMMFLTVFFTQRLTRKIRELLWKLKF